MMKIAMSYFGENHTSLCYFARQLDVKYCVTNTGWRKGVYAPAKPWDMIVLREIKQLCNDFGMEWAVFEGVDFIDDVKLGTDKKDEAIKNFCTFLENLSAVGVKTVCYNWMPVWSWFRTRTHENARGGALSTGFHYDDVRDLPVSSGGRVTADQLWTNLEYFLKKVVPVAEKVKVQLAVHPDDPPVPVIAGIDRILITPDAMMKVCDLYPSEYNGITLCQGTFSSMNSDIPAEIRRFGKKGKLFFSHFRDVRGTPENFMEVFHDEGRTDMYEAMKAYYEIGYQGVSRPDHVPTMYGDDNSSPAYGINGNLFAVGYMRGLMESIEHERGIFKKETRIVT
jgi:mannonate dehydratase